MLKQYNIPNIIPANTVMNANRTSQAIQLQNNITYAIQIVFTGTPNGSFKLQAGADPVFNAVSSGNYTGINLPTHWTDVADSTFVVSAAGDVMWNVAEIGYNWVRVVFTDASGGLSTAVISSAVVNGKGV